jgi:hypothetical protein
MRIHYERNASASAVEFSRAELFDEGCRGCWRHSAAKAHHQPTNAEYRQVIEPEHNRPNNDCYVQHIEHNPIAESQDPGADAHTQKTANVD